MKLFAALAIAAVNGLNTNVKCWEGEGNTVAEFDANKVKVDCTKNQICQMTVRKRAGEVYKVMGSCKQDVACDNNREQNFGSEKQCRPEEILDENDAEVVSVCRSCSDTPWEQLNSASFATDADWQRNLLW